VAKRDSVVFTVGYRIYDHVFILLATVLGVLTLGFQAPKVLILGVGATINFIAPGCNATDRYIGKKYPVDITFDNPTLVDTASSYDPTSLYGSAKSPPTGNGNIAAFACDVDSTTGKCVYPANADMFRARSFPVAGTYHYHSSLYPSDTFTIIIKKD
jgi:hypothetical protein